MRLILLLVLFPVHLFAFVAPTYASEKDDVLRKCEQLFGKPVDALANLYEIDKDFVLEAKFENDELVRLKLAPKFWYNKSHSEWTEPDDYVLFTRQKRAEYLSMLDTIKPKGKLIRKDLFAFVSNRTAPMSEYYENAFLEYGNLNFIGHPDPDGDKPITRWMRIDFIGSVTRKVVRKETFGVPRVSLFGYALVNYLIVPEEREDPSSGSCERYYVSPKEFARINTKSLQSFRGAYVGDCGCKRWNFKKIDKFFKKKGKPLQNR